MINLPPMTLLDKLVSTKENLMLKVLLPYIDRNFQPFMAIYIKYSELLATTRLFNSISNPFNTNETALDMMDIIDNLLPYLSPTEQQSFEMFGNIKNMMNMFEQYKDIFSTTDMDEYMNSNEDNDEENNEPNNKDNEATNSKTDDNSSYTNQSSPNEQTNMNDMLSVFLSPEQQQLFQYIGGIK